METRNCQTCDASFLFSYDDAFMNLQKMFHCPLHRCKPGAHRYTMLGSMPRLICVDCGKPRLSLAVTVKAVQARKRAA